MRAFSLIHALTVLGAAIALPAMYKGASNAICTTQIYQIPLASYTTFPFSSAITENPSQAAVTSQIQQYVSNVGNFTEAFMTGSNTSSGTYGISGTLCVPKDGDKHEGTIQLLVHGVGFDSSYWDFSYQPQSYSYVYAAAKEGYTTFAYDRLGTGKSDKPDGYHIVQAPTDVGIIVTLIAFLHAGAIGGKPYDKIIGVGHSYGSIQLTAASSIVPSQLSALVLTGFSSNASYTPQFATSNAFSRADVTYPSRFAGLSGEYVVSGLPQSSQINFLFYPFYDPTVADVQWATAAPVTMGVLLTVGALPSGASGFTGPVHVVSGDRDWAFCGGQCDIRPDGVHTMLQEVGLNVFPKSGDFSVYSPANTGHGVNLHFSAPQTYANILGWLKAIRY